MTAKVNLKGEQVSISGDDILIEYCERLIKALQKVPEN